MRIEDRSEVPNADRELGLDPKKKSCLWGTGEMAASSRRMNWKGPRHLEIGHVMTSSTQQSMDIKNGQMLGFLV